LKQERQKVLQEVGNLHGKLGENDRAYADKIGRLDSENKTLTNEYREAQEKLRVSTSQIGKLANEFNEVKQRIDQLTRENDVLKQERAKVLQELSKVHEQLGLNDRSYADKMNKLDHENKTLTNEYREAQ
jgi:uncharacterized protein (UPF0335 family)